MTRRCFMVYPLPSVADESFLQLLFDGGVRRSAFAGFGKRRFALVELQGDTQAEAVWRAIGPALPNSVATTAAAAETHGGGSVNLDEDCTLAELFAAHNAATIAAAAAPNVDGAAGQSCMSFFGRLRFRGTPLQVVPSPVTIEELYSCGGQVPQPRPTAAGDQEGPRDKRSHAQKRLRPSGAEDAAGHAAQTVEREPKRSAAAASSRDACRRCGSTTHFTRQCTADPSSEESTSAAPAIAVESAAATDSCVAVDTATEGTSRLQQSHRRGAKNEFPQNCCQKCGSSAHFTRHCDGGNAADEAPRPQELPVPVSVADHGERSKPLALQQEHSKPQPKQQQQQQQRQQHHQLQQDRPQRPAVVRTSKDQCKHCGSDLHLSRHCPSK
ncbi:hypothetical protein DQ04_07851010 [Trypanosoma grayi]|uniref:hypothetical protein n=1 Tax=Trypanosoma grayi TaxID=71804 RepID=UPI0004F45355|nr:hypothetical protein DQ04_07851010 [Trypanosoma grayi]KEG08163.1 hypothetical protein DQ04_07851010 [Trypanosoma grayi]